MGLNLIQAAGPEERERERESISLPGLQAAVELQGRSVHGGQVCRRVKAEWNAYSSRVRMFARVSGEEGGKDTYWDRA